MHAHFFCESVEVSGVEELFQRQSQASVSLHVFGGCLQSGGVALRCLVEVVQWGFPFKVVSCLTWREQNNGRQ